MQQRLLLAGILIIAGISITSIHAHAAASIDDIDGDGLINTAEDANGNHRWDDGETDPLNADTDGGGESDGTERIGGRNPLDHTDDLTFDGDSDGLPMAIEHEKGTDPRKPDTDGDGLSDAVDPFPTDGRYTVDRNDNGLPDEWEAKSGLLNDNDKTASQDDADGDGLTNLQEWIAGTNPRRSDTDGDGTNDAAELSLEKNPRENACLLYEQAEDFIDTRTHWAQAFIRTLRGTVVAPSTPIIVGYAQGTGSAFLPDRPVTRFEFAKMLLLSLCRSPSAAADPDTPSFIDLPKARALQTSSEEDLVRRVVYSAAHDGILLGYPDGSVRPHAPIVRAEAVAMIIRAMAARQALWLDDEAPTMNFADFDTTSWYADAMQRAVASGIVEGYGDGTVRPGWAISRAEAATVILRSLRQNPLINGYIVPEPSAQTTTPPDAR